MRMKTQLKALAAAAAFLVGLHVAGTQAYAQGIAALEGPITSVSPATNRMVVMGITVIVPPGTPIVSPTASLTLDQLLGAPFPGRTQPGFVGGTAIINGRVNANRVSITATDVFVEPSENVLIGTISASTCTNPTCSGPGNILRALGRPVIRLNDPRMPAEPIKNDFGFELNLTGANLAGRPVALEGYSSGTNFFYFLMEITGVPLGLLARPTVTEVSVMRADCRADPVDGIDLNILGGVHTPRIGTVTIDGGAGVTGTTEAIAADTRFGIYTFRQTFPLVTVCPASVTATFGAATATADVRVLP